MRTIRTIKQNVTLIELISQSKRAPEPYTHGLSFNTIEEAISLAGFELEAHQCGIEGTVLILVPKTNLTPTRN